MKWNGKIRDGEKGGSNARVRDGALEVRIVGGSSPSGTVDSVARASAAAAQAEIDTYTDFDVDETIIGKNEAGVTLYRKGIPISNGPSGGVITYAHGVTGILTVERQWGRLTRISTNDHIPLPYPHVTQPIQASVSGANVSLNSAGSFGAFSGIYWIEYTRS